MSISIGINSPNGFTGAVFQNRIIEVSGFNLAGNTLTLSALSRWEIRSKEITNLTNEKAEIPDSTGVVRLDRVLLDRFGKMTIQTGYPAFPGGQSYLRPIDITEFVEISVISNDNNSVTTTDPFLLEHQFSDSQYLDILALIYKNSVNLISLNTLIGEKGISTPLTVSYSILSNNDVMTLASINNGIGSVLPQINTGNNNVSGGSAFANKTFTLAMSFTRNGIATPENKTATYTAYVPQFAGVSALTDFANLADITGADLEKFVQASNSITKQSSATAQYIWFISNKNNAAILDQNNFAQSVGAWNDGVSEFYLKPLVIKLADATTATVYLYRSRNVKTLVNFTYKIQ
jgi:hypothetical protein